MSVLPPTSRRRWFIYGITVLLIAAGVRHFSTREKPADNRRGPNPTWAGTGSGQLQPVRVVKAEKRDLAVHLKAIGTVTPLNTVSPRASDCTKSRLFSKSTDPDALESASASSD